MNALARNSRLLAAAAVVAKRIGDSQITSGINLSASTEKAVGVQMIEACRRRHGFTQGRLAASAGVSDRWLRALVADPEQATGRMINRLADALRRLIRKQTLDDIGSTALIEASYGGFLIAMAAHYGITADQVRATDPRAGHTASPHWRRCSHARQAAIYLTHTTLHVSQRALARTVGLTEAAVCLAVRSVEDRREEIALDRALDKASAAVTGRLTTG